MKTLTVVITLCALLLQGCAEDPRSREAETLFVSAKQKEALQTPEGRSEALGVYQMVAQDYADTQHGKRAQAEFDRLSPVVAKEMSSKLNALIQEAAY